MDSNHHRISWGYANAESPRSNNAQGLSGALPWAPSEPRPNLHRSNNAIQPEQGAFDVMNDGGETFSSSHFNEHFDLNDSASRAQRSPIDSIQERQYHSASYFYQEINIDQDQTWLASHTRSLPQVHASLRSHEGVAGDAGGIKAGDGQLWRDDKLWPIEADGDYTKNIHRHPANISDLDTLASQPTAQHNAGAMFSHYPPMIRMYDPSFGQSGEVALRSDCAPVPQEFCSETDCNRTNHGGQPEPWNPLWVCASDGIQHDMYNNQSCDAFRRSSTRPSISHSSAWTSSGANDRSTETSIDPTLLEKSVDTLVRNSGEADGTYIPREGSCIPLGSVHHQGAGTTSGSSGVQTSSFASIADHAARQAAHQSGDLGQFLAVPKPPSPSLSTVSITPASVAGCLKCPHDGCPRVYTGRHRRGNLGRHVRLKHGHVEKIYFCAAPKCGKTFKRQDALLKHHRKRHVVLQAVTTQYQI